MFLFFRVPNIATFNLFLSHIHTLKFPQPFRKPLHFILIHLHPLVSLIPIPIPQQPHTVSLPMSMSLYSLLHLPHLIPCHAASLTKTKVSHLLLTPRVVTLHIHQLPLYPTYQPKTHNLISQTSISPSPTLPSHNHIHRIPRFPLMPQCSPHHLTPCPVQQLTHLTHSLTLHLHQHQSLPISYPIPRLTTIQLHPPSSVKIPRILWLCLHPLLKPSYSPSIVPTSQPQCTHLIHQPPRTRKLSQPLPISPRSLSTPSPSIQRITHHLPCLVIRQPMPCKIPKSLRRPIRHPQSKLCNPQFIPHQVILRIPNRHPLQYLIRRPYLPHLQIINSLPNQLKILTTNIIRKPLLPTDISTNQNQSQHSPQHPSHQATYLIIYVHIPFTHTHKYILFNHIFPIPNNSPTPQKHTVAHFLLPTKPVNCPFNHL